MKRARVLVGLSGGVDSSVAALRLKAQGYEVIGAFIRVWHPPFIQCDEARDRLDAMRVAAELRIPFVTIDARKAYEKEVAEVMISEYAQGRTPNPDILCNRVVKFGVFEQARKDYHADFLATGHYARVQHVAGAPSELHAAVDSGKDQSYFLSGIAQSALTQVLFPLGESMKKDVRAEAMKAGLHSATRKDSQGICFLGKLDMRDFLAHYIPKKEGVVLSLTGETIGTHEGAHFYTFGERHGFTIVDTRMRAKPMYVVAKDVVQNTLTVSDTQPRAQAGTTFTLSSFNALQEKPLAQREYDAVFRYHGARTPVAVSEKEGTVSLTVQGGSMLPAPGQTCVLYLGTRVAGGGIIEA
jgi:tRNA-specific 2-thiouridylase